MKKTYTLLTFICIFIFVNKAHSQATVCDSTGNLIIYSNYNGGELTINVDVNIPNLKIGLESYCFEHVTVTGAYAGNVTGIWWAGYNSMNNNCTTPMPYNTTITGAFNATIDTIATMTPVTYNDPNGYPNMIMCYQCVTNPGALNNTPAQVVDFFQTHLGGTFRYHFTQYGCWTGTYSVSAGGNCCLVPSTSVSVNEINNEEAVTIYPNPFTSETAIVFSQEQRNITIKVVDVLGKVVLQSTINSKQSKIDMNGYSKGMYFLQVTDADKNTINKKIVLQ